MLHVEDVCSAIFHVPRNAGQKIPRVITRCAPHRFEGMATGVNVDTKAPEAIMEARAESYFAPDVPLYDDAQDFARSVLLK